MSGSLTDSVCYADSNKKCVKKPAPLIKRSRFCTFILISIIKPLKNQAKALDIWGFVQIF
jgi:hypothetical protein